MLRKRPLRKIAGEVIKERAREGPLIKRLAQRIRQRPLLESFFNEWKPKRLTAQKFYEDFIREASQARDHVIIFSPFSYTKRVNELLRLFSNLTKRKVKVEVHTLNPSSRSIKSWSGHKENINNLRNANVKIVLRKNMHEKAVFIDGRTSYLGSLNVLSGGKSDYMLKFESEELTKIFQSFIELLEETAEPH